VIAYIPSSKIALATVNQCPFDWENNFTNLKQALIQAKENGKELLFFPELAVSGYSCEDTFLSKWLAESALDYLGKLIPLTEGMWTNFGMPLWHKDHLYNCSVIVENKKIIGVAAKQKLANEGVYYEQRWFNPWPAGKVDEIMIHGQKVPIGELIFDFKGTRIGFEICEDAWHEKSRPGNQYFEKGVDIIFNPSASHFSFGKAFFRRDLIIQSSKKFDCLYLYSNLLGNDSGRLIFDGEMLAAYKGELQSSNRFFSFQPFKILDLSDQNEQVEKDLSDLNFFPRAVSLALFDYLRRSRSKGFVISLSGGADSSCCSVLVNEMIKNAIRELGVEGFKDRLGLKRELKGDNQEELVNELLVTAYQKTSNSSTKSLEASRDFSDSIGAKFYEWSVEGQTVNYRKTIEQMVGKELTWEEDDISLQNIQARARNPGIWLLANHLNFLLITTSNRSELDVGYATMDGDTAGSLGPIAGVSKHFLLEWLRYAYKNLGYKGLKKNLELIPTAELRPPELNQSDEEDLMPYRALEFIEKFAIGHRLSPVEVLKEMKAVGYENNEELKVWIKKFYRLWSRNQWKRERTAPSFHLDDFNVDPKTWCRFPILSGGFEKELIDLDKL
jgi:NAD+ synthase (glutamine-hydrolysing)